LAQQATALGNSARGFSPLYRLGWVAADQLLLGGNPVALAAPAAQEQHVSFFVSAESGCLRNAMSEELARPKVWVQIRQAPSICLNQPDLSQTSKVRDLPPSSTYCFTAAAKNMSDFKHSAQ
jgi:hypothetical protein